MKTDYRKLLNKPWLGEWDVPVGEDLILTIDHVNQGEVVGDGGSSEERMVVHFREEGVKPMVCNVTNGETISQLVGSKYVEDWSGTKIAIYSTPVKAFGKTTNALRVRPYPPKTDEYICAECGLVIEDAEGFTARQIAEGSRAKYGKVLCIEHGKAEKEKREAAAKETDVLGGTTDEDNENQD
jgi:hypothetical protein